MLKPSLIVTGILLIVLLFFVSSHTEIPKSLSAPLISAATAGNIGMESEIMGIAWPGARVEFYVNNNHLINDDVVADDDGSFRKVLFFFVEGPHSLKVRQVFGAVVSDFAELSPVIVHLQGIRKVIVADNTQKLIQGNEDSALKIERCKSEARIIARNDRYKAAVATELLKCYANPSCNYQNTELFIRTVEENSRESSYESNYNRCLTSSRQEFERMNQMIESAWKECEGEYPGEQDVALYNKRMKCVMPRFGN